LVSGRENMLRGYGGGLDGKIVHGHIEQGGPYLFIDLILITAVRIKIFYDL
jgi:hypothetical protein